MTFPALLAAALLAAAAHAAPEAPQPPPAAPPDVSTAVWVNTPGPLTLSKFLGRAVILEFSDQWSGEDEQALLRAQAAQATYPDASALVSVRTRQRGDEGGPAALELEALRRRILTPMVEDPDRLLARAYSVTRLPAQVLLDARGRFVRLFAPGEPADALVKAVGGVVAGAKQDHDLWTSTGPSAPAWDRYADGPLAFPTGLAFDARSGLLAVCDTGHDRVVVADADGRVRFVAGHGAPEYRDGPAALAGFDRPHAVSFTGQQLGVADSGNDYLRVVELADRRVASWFGRVSRFGWPAALLAGERATYFGSSSAHQLFAVDSGAAQRYVLAGDGVAGDRDGLPPVARLREPASLALLGDTLYVADPEAGLLRALSVSAPDLTTPALKGTGAPLRRPAAVAALDGKLYIADAGDGSLKQLEPESGELRVLARGLKRPSGLTVVRGDLLVAETDGSRLLRYSTAGKPLGELRLRGLEPLPQGPPALPTPARAAVEELPASAARAGAEDTLEISVALPDGMILNPRAPTRARYVEADGDVKVPLDKSKTFFMPGRLPLRLGFRPVSGSVSLLVDVDFFYCRRDRKGLCFAAAKRYRVPVTPSAAAKQRVVRVTARP